MDKPAVLLLERDANVIDIAQKCLADEVELHVANTVELALRITVRRPVMVAVLDATMAGLIPTDTVTKLRAARPGMRIVFLAEPAFDLDRRYGTLGSVLRKPVSLERLADSIRNALRLRNMSDGVQRMRSSSGTYPAVRLPEIAPPLPPSPSAPPPSNSVPPPPEAHGASDAAERKRESGAPERSSDGPPARWRDSGVVPRDLQKALSNDDEEAPPRSITPRPFARIR
jgi:DNA-binding NarL/FixJ family response regulator